MKVLDLFCGSGGAAKGYMNAGFDVTGIDVNPMPHYCARFVQGDALEYLEKFGHEYDLIHASPPCQSYSIMKHFSTGKHPELIVPTRELLIASGKPYIMENVVGAPLIDPVLLCGTMFDIPVRRHRIFECSFPAHAPMHPDCRNGVRDGWLIGQRVSGRVRNGQVQPPHHTEAQRRDAIGVPWMTARESRQSIPPKYTEYLGKEFLHG